MRREWGNVTKQISTINDVLQQYGKENQASGGLIYNNSDTNALMYVLKNIGGMSQIFNNNLWEPSKPESEGRWLVDRKGDPYAAAGASATTVLIAITSDTLRLAGGTSTGQRTLAANGMATAVKVASTTWYINGTGLT
jgi:CubicO group peptidase (beta-lactamase class C family)